MEDIILLGCGGHAKSIIDVIEKQENYRIVGILDSVDNLGYKYRGHEVIGNDNKLQELFDSGIRNAFICIGYLGVGDIRNRLYNLLKGIGYILPTFIDSTAAIAIDVQIGEGVFVGKNAIVNSAANIGKMVIVNTGAIVEHDCVIKDFSHVSVGSILCGSVTVGKNCFVGANATIIQNISIGEKALIGAGSIILSDIKPEERVVGVVNKHVPLERG